MSAAAEEPEEGEITDSDSMGEDEQRPSIPSVKPQPVPPQQYSLFGEQPRTAQPRTAQPSFRPLPRPPCSGSDSNSSNGEDSDDADSTFEKRSRVHDRGEASNLASNTFVNPNFVNNGGLMPPIPKQSSRTIWGSVLQEQILTAEVGNFSMEKKVPSDRNVESYDYTRAKDDDRPHPVEDEINCDEELFGEVIDLEKSTLRQNKTLKRKHGQHVGDRLGKRNSVKERLDLPKVTESSSVEEVTYYISTMLEETKVHLIRRVVQTIRPAKALDLLNKTEDVEAAGGMMIMNGARRRTKGGVYLTLLKSDTEVTKEQMDEIFAEENQWALDMKKRKKVRARRRKAQRMQDEQPGGGKGHSKATPEEGKGDNTTVTMEEDVREDANSRSSVEGQTGSPRHPPGDPLSDGGGAEPLKGRGERLSSGEYSDSGDEDDKSSDDQQEEEGDFQAQLEKELQRQASSAHLRNKGEGGVSSAAPPAEAVTLDDVLDIDVDEEFLD